MRLVKITEFLTWPKGTLYSECRPLMFTGLFIKGDTLYHQGVANDFTYSDLIGSIACYGSDHYSELLDKACNDPSFKLKKDYDFQRDGSFWQEEDDIWFAIYDPAEVVELVNKIIEQSGLIVGPFISTKR